MRDAPVILSQLTDTAEDTTEYTGSLEEGVDYWQPPYEEDTGFRVFIWIGAAILIFGLFKIVRMIVEQRSDR